MNQDQITELVKRTLYEVAPDLATEPLDPKARFSVQFEFDSMDFLKFVTGLHMATGLALPEKDYPHLASLELAVKYLAEKLPA
jgi:acyl carrier protein